MNNPYSEIEAASRYDAARSLPAQTKALWLEAIKSSLPAQKIGRVLDLGCGTGRFTAALGESFGCPVIGVEPSAAMLDVARARGEAQVVWRQGQAERIPLENEAVDLVFMSQVFHHLARPRRAVQEIRRVLTPAGYLVIRNGTREHHAEIEWLKCFPEARAIEEQRMLSRHELRELVCAQSFALISWHTVRQLFAASYDEYYEKISQRGLSSLLAISDEAFQAGLRRFKDRVNVQARTRPVYEPVDLFVFKKL